VEEISLNGKAILHVVDLKIKYFYIYKGFEYGIQSTNALMLRGCSSLIRHQSRRMQ
jgi:hypothetical protein